MVSRTLFITSMVIVKKGRLSLALETMVKSMRVTTSFRSPSIRISTLPHWLHICWKQTRSSSFFKAFFKQQTDFTHPNQKEIIIFTWDDDSEVGIKRSLQKMTDNNLSSLYGLNHVEIIKTSNFPKDLNTLRMFLSRHISNEIQVSVTYNQLLEEYRNNRTL